MNSKYWFAAIAAFLVLFCLPAFAGNLEVSSVSYNPSPAIPGQSINLFVNVTNKSTAAASGSFFNLTLKSDQSETTFPFALDPTDTTRRDLGDIQPGKTALVRFKILLDPSATDGSYSIFFELGTDGKTEKTTPYSISVLSRKPIIKIVSASPDSAEIGKSAMLEIVVKNIGSSRAINLSVGLDEERTVTSTGVVVERNVVPLGAGSVYVPQLNANESVPVSLPFIINPGAQANAYYIPINVEFFDENKSKYSEKEYVGIKASNEPEIGATLAESEPLPVPGGKTKLSLELYNVGIGSAQFLTVRVDSNDMFLSQKEFFIGTLESDDFDSVAIDTTINKDSATGEKELLLAFSYKNGFGEEVSVEKKVPFKIYSAAEIAAQNPAQTPWLLYIGIIVAAGIGYWWFKKRKKKAL